MFKFNRGTETQVLVEYRSPYWIVLVRSPGQREWVPIRDSEKNIVVMDEFGDTVMHRPAIKAFPFKQDADNWVEQHMKSAQAVNARSQSESAVNWKPTKYRSLSAYSASAAGMTSD